MNKELKIILLKKMLLLRNFDVQVSKLFHNGKIKGSVHTYIGQEAIASGVSVNLKDEDFIITTHRCHGHTLSKNGDPRKILSEIFGRIDGYCKGRGGSMHIMSKDIRSLAFPVVGAGIPVGTGIAFGFKKQNKSNVVVIFFGEGASNQGTFHESLNIASIFKLPVLFVCENNKYAVSSDITRMANVENISIRARSYGFESFNIDGNDVAEVYEVSKKSIESIREGRGPQLIEAKTFRWEGHYSGEPGVYRDKNELEKWQHKCPIKRFKELLIKEKIITEKTFNELDSDIKNEIEEACEFAFNSPEFEADKFNEYVYKE